MRSASPLRILAQRRKRVILSEAKDLKDLPFPISYG